MIDIDFLPEKIKAQRALHRRLVIQGYLMVIILAGLVGFWWSGQSRINKASAESAELTSQLKSIESKLAARSVLEKELAALMIKKQIDDKLGSRVNALDTLAELNRLLPETMALTHLNVDAMAVKAASSRGGRAGGIRPIAANGNSGPRVTNRVTLVIRGLAPNDVDIANFIGQLSACPLFEDVSMGYAKNKVFRGRTAREFQATCHIAQ